MILLSFILFLFFESNTIIYYQHRKLQDTVQQVIPNLPLQQPKSRNLRD